MSQDPTDSVRVRFAPSPTGFLHIGGMRSAVFNWLWAKHNDGKFLLRIEDTDRSRLVEGAQSQIEESLSLLGMAPDEPLEIQSQRLQGYRQAADTLLKSGDLYKCWCTPERLSQLRTTAQEQGRPFKYDRHCLQPGNAKADDEPHVLRFKIPDEPAEVGWDDAVRGSLSVKTTELDDFVALKSDGFPTYHLANVVDDHAMEISHVLRADEWLPSTPKHLLLFTALSWRPPVYAHLPAVLGPAGNKKLSKRDGAKSVQDFIDVGYLSEAIINFLAGLGWNDGTTKEIYTVKELCDAFTLDRIQKSPARFDIERLNWMNGVYIRNLGLDKLYERCEGFWPEGAADRDADYRKRTLSLVHERLKFLGELPELVSFFFTDPAVDNAMLTKDYGADDALGILSEAIDELRDSDFTESDLETRLRKLVDAKGLKTGKFFGLLRVAVTGRTMAPGLFETLHTLGKDGSLRRLENAAQGLREHG